MALSVDSSWHRWQRQVREGFPQSPSEATPLLLPEKQTPSCNLAQRRVVFPNNNAFHQDWEKFSRRYSSNRICTTKYTLFTFLPQNLLEQFHRYTTAWLNAVYWTRICHSDELRNAAFWATLPLVSKCTYLGKLCHSFICSFNIYQILLGVGSCVVY